MLSDKKIIAFVPAINPERAKAFYKDTLGLTLLSEGNNALEFNANGTLLRITIVENLSPHPFTVLGWVVDDIVFLIKSLVSKGVAFERYIYLEQDSLGIWTSPGGAKVAWFKDPVGNLLSLTE